MVRYAVGYRSRAFVTFGTPIRMDEYDPHARRDVLDLAIRTREAIGRLVKIVPTALVAASLRRSMTRRELELRVAALIERLQALDANLAVTDAREAVDAAARLLETRGIIVVEGGRVRVRERYVLRFYARSVEHLVPVPADRTH
jgi:hypothetical protein